MTEERSFQECGTCERRIGDDLDKDTRTDHNRDYTDCKALNETNTRPKKKQGPVQIVRKVKKKKPIGEKLSGSPHRSLCPRHKKIKYHLSSVDDDDMTDSKLSPKSIGFLYVSTDPRRAGQAVGGETFILTIEELKTILEIQRNMEDQQIWLTTAQAGFPTTPAEDEVSNPRDLQLGRVTVRLLHPEISVFIE